MAKEYRKYLAACRNDSCKSRTKCRRWQDGMDRKEDRIYVEFKPSSGARKCIHFIADPYCPGCILRRFPPCSDGIPCCKCRQDYCNSRQPCEKDIM